MTNYQILIEYEGTKFVGWQIQKNGVSVQEVIQKALRKLTKKNIVVFGAGRTDSGVHAIEHSAHFKTNYKIKNKSSFLRSLNFFMREYNVSILNMIKKKSTFHARHSALKRTYKYYIINRTASLSLNKKKAWHVEKKLNLTLMKKRAKLLQGTKNFSTYRSSSCTAKSPIKTLEKAKIIMKDKKIEITFQSKSFLQQQVRSMVGCLKYLGEKRWTLEKFRRVMNLKKRSNCAPPAPACGLYIYKVDY